MAKSDEALNEVRAEIDRLRRLIPEQPDRHLNVWGNWRQKGQISAGFKTKSTCLSNLKAANDETDENRRDDNDEYTAEISDAIIADIKRVFPHYEMVISNVYESRVATFRPGVEDELLIGAAAEFWRRAVRRGLV